jgi:hypothetical protein
MKINLDVERSANWGKNSTSWAILFLLHNLQMLNALESQQPSPEEELINGNRNILSTISLQFSNGYMSATCQNLNVDFKNCTDSACVNCNTQTFGKKFILTESFEHMRGSQRNFWNL